MAKDLRPFYNRPFNLTSIISNKLPMNIKREKGKNVQDPPIIAPATPPKPQQKL